VLIRFSANDQVAVLWFFDEAHLQKNQTPQQKFEKQLLQRVFNEYPTRFVCIFEEGAKKDTLIRFKKTKKQNEVFSLHVRVSWSLGHLTSL
jgi:hypothetical protein